MDRPSVGTLGASAHAVLTHVFATHRHSRWRALHAGFPYRGAQCPYCGATVTDGARHCSVCLRPLAGIPVPSEPPVGFPILPAGGTQIAEWQPDEDVTGAEPAPGPPTSKAFESLQPGQSFGHRYKIIKLLGVGGMGAVYQAWDSELGVAVALKMIRPDVSANQAAAQALERRFKQELLLARQVTHKNVVRIHDLGEIDGTKYITMSYVDGWSLSALLHARDKLPVPEALRIARQVASGLQAAHEAGVDFPCSHYRL